jgi:hypothetical protein
VWTGTNDLRGVCSNAESVPRAATSFGGLIVPPLGI